MARVSDRVIADMTRSMEVAVTGQSRVELFPLRGRQDADQFIIGRPATGSYVALSDGALVAVQLLADGSTLAETKAALVQEHPGQEHRLGPLLETLLTAGLVKAIDGVPLPEARVPRRYHLTFLKPRHVDWLFTRPAAAVYVTLAGLGAAIVLAHPRYLPRPGDALVSSGPMMNLALLWGVSALAMAMHELAHLVAATHLGVKASFALSNRLFFAVAQTDLTDLWLVDRNQRYLAYGAGMVNDLLLASAAVSALWLHDQGILPLPSLAYRTLKLAVLVLVFGVLWQFNFYLRTDVYYLIANFTGCRNLKRDATAYLKAKVARGFAGAGSQLPAGVPEKEMRIVRAFAVLMVIGTAGVVTLGAAYLGALFWVLVGGKTALPGWRSSAEPVVSVAPVALVPSLASLGIAGCWLALAFMTKRRRRPHVRYRLRCPEDL